MNRTKKAMSWAMSLILVVVTLAAVVLCGTVNSYADSYGSHTIRLQIGNTNMTIDGVTKKIDSNGTTPVIINNRTMMPIRAIVESMGGSVGWDEDTRSVDLYYGDKSIMLVIDAAKAWANDDGDSSVIALDSPPVIINSRTLLPVRVIMEFFGASVDWNGNSQTITISYGSGSSSASISEDQAYDAIVNYCYAQNPDLSNIVQNGYNVYWSLGGYEGREGNNIVVFYRSYTGAVMTYYVDPESGLTTEYEYVPGITDEPQPSGVVFNIRDYMY